MCKQTVYFVQLSDFLGVFTVQHHIVVGLVPAGDSC